MAEDLEFLMGADTTNFADGIITSGGGSGVVVTNQPGTPISNQTLSVVVESDKDAASILINGENTYKTTRNYISFNLADLIANGSKTITVQKEGFESKDSYVISYKSNGVYSNSTFTGYDYNSIPYASEPYYTFDVRHYNNGYDQAYTNDTSTTKRINFKLDSVVKPIEETPLSTITIKINGPAGSVSAIQNANNALKLKDGINEIASTLGDKISISSSDLNLYRIKSIKLTDGAKSKSIDAKSDAESVATKISLDSLKYAVEIDVEPSLISTQLIPNITFVNTESREYNIHGKSDYPIGLYKNSAVTNVRVSINGNEYKFNTPEEKNTLIKIPAAAFNKLGNYKVVIVPNGPLGDGAKLETVISVIDAIYVGVPDIRNIQYPSLLQGADYVGTNVFFDITYDTINTDYVQIYKDKSTKFVKAPAKGGIRLNFKDILALDGVGTEENEDLISVTLKLVPYNTSGFKTITGKEELITIKFDKGDLTVPRTVAIARLAEGFINQFDDTVFEDETSKYLTHLLHLGDGNNKVITTWTGSLGSLIVKLYEPLPTSVQPNQQIWISKLQSNPIIETVNVTGLDELVCNPLKGPNFSLESDNGIGFQVYDDLIASGSTTSADLVNRYLQSTGIDTTKLNIQYSSGSTYMFENFSNFGSSEERIHNFYYKVQLIETYKTKYEQLIADTFIPPYGAFDGGLLTQDGYQTITEDGIFDIQWEIFQPKGFSQKAEAKKYFDALNEIIRAFDGYERFLYSSTNDLAYPKQIYTHPITGLTTFVLRKTTDSETIAWYNSLVNLSYEYDKYNPSYLVNNIPEFIREDYQNADFVTFLNMIGQHFDILWCYINALKGTKLIEEKQVKGVSNTLVHNLLESLGWDTKKAFNSEFLWEYAFGTYKDGFQKYGMSLEEANNQVWRRILNNLPYLLKHKGTGRAMKAVMACYGVPQSMLTIMEFGGPQDPTEGGSTKFTFDDRTAALHLKPSSSILLPWHKVADTNEYPKAIEFRIKPDVIKADRIISSSYFNLNIVPTTGSFAQLTFSLGDDSTATYFEEPFASGSPVVSTVYITPESNGVYALGPETVTGSLAFPLSTEDYSNILINKYDYDSSTLFEILFATSNGSRITTYVSMSLFTAGSPWESGSGISLGNTFSGSLDEVRLWRVPLQPSKFQNHTLHPDAINGNSYTASTADLLLRLDFEYPKDRTITENLGIKNVAINESYGETIVSSSYMYSASAYPYQYIPYDRTVTATVPSLGFNTSNKIRFEQQELLTDLSYKKRATKKSFDRAPIDSSRLGLFFSPIKELNMDIIKAFGDFNIDNYIGDPSDEYKDKYSELDTLRHYYFERLDRNIYEYIQLVRYIDKSLFDVLADLAPARAKVSKGLLIEPHYLERSKIRWDKPKSERNDFTTIIDTRENYVLESTTEDLNANVDGTQNTNLEVDLPNYETLIDSTEIYNLEATNPNYETVINYYDLNKIESSYPTYPPTGSVLIEVPVGGTITGEVDSFNFEAIGMDRDSLANAGFGLYANRGNGIVGLFDGLFGNYETTGSRKSIFLVKEKYTQYINTQLAGYPVNGALPGDQVYYEKIPVTKYKYKVSTLPFSGSVTIGGDVVEVTALNGYFPTHYKYKNNLFEGMIRSFHKGSTQTALTTPDGLSPVETFTTNPNILRVAKTGRGSGEPILEVD